MIRIILTPTDINNLNTPYTIAPEPNQQILNLDLDIITGSYAFYEIKRIVWKLDYNTTPYNFTGSLCFQIGNEHIASLQADSLTSNFKVATISNMMLCKDKESPLVQCNTPLTLVASGSTPSSGDSNIIIEIDYEIHNI